MGTLASRHLAHGAASASFLPTAQIEDGAKEGGCQGEGLGGRASEVELRPDPAAPHMSLSFLIQGMG